MLTDFAKNKKIETFQIFDQNHGLTPLEKPQFLTFLTVFFLWSKKAFFPFYSIVKRIMLTDFPKNKKMENFQIFDQNHGLTPLEKSQFLTFLTFCFL